MSERRGRKEQRRVTTQHHVRSLPQLARQEQRQTRKAKALPQKMVDAAHAEEKAGRKLKEIVAERWQEWGCESKAQADRLIRERFRASGYATRGRGRPETSGISKSRAPSRRRGFPLSKRARLEYERQRQAEMQNALANPELAVLVDDQGKDSRSYRIPNRPWLMSLDEVLRDEDKPYGERLAVRFARKRGDFRAEAPWVEPLIRRIDDLRERCDAA